MRKICLFVVGLLAFPWIAKAQPLADQVPGDAIVYVGWAGASNMGNDYAKSHLKAVVDRSDWNDFFTRFLPQVFRRIGQSDRNAEEASQLVAAVASPMWKYPTAFYFGGVSFDGPDRPVPKIAFYCRAGDDAVALQRTLNDAIAKAPRQRDDPAIEVAVNEGLLTVTIGQKVAAGQPLLTSAEFTSAMKVAHKQPVFTAYVDGDRLLQFANNAVINPPNPDAAERWPALRDALGLNGFKSLVYTGGFDDANWVTFARVHAPAPRTGLMQVLDSKPLSKEIVTAIPVTAVMASAGTFDVAGLLDAIRDGGSKVDPDFAQNYGAVMGYIGGLLGVEVRDLVEPLGNEWASYLDPTIGGSSVLGLTVVNQLDDAAKARELFTKAEQSLNRTLARQLQRQKMTVAFKQVERDGVSIHYLALPIITPAWAIEGSRLYVGLYPQTVASAVSQARTSDGKSILDNPAYVDTRTKLGEQAATAIQFMDVPKLVPTGYSSWVLLSRFAGYGDLFGIDSPVMLVPPLHELASHLAPAGAVAWSDAEGWYARSISSFPGSETLASDPVSGYFSVAPTALGVSILLPSLNRARETANRVKSASNLRMIGQGMLLFANENRNRYPDDLGELVLTQDMGVEVFTNPRRGTSVPNEIRNADIAVQADWVSTNSDYIYAGAGKNADAPPDQVMAYERLDGLDDGINVLFGDGHVEFVSPMERARALVGK